MLRLAIAIIGVAACWLASTDCRAQARCPWLNAATAAGVLGGEVQMTVTVPEQPDPTTNGVDGYSAPEQRFNRPDAICEFIHSTELGMYKLSIDVKTMRDPAKQYASFVASCNGVTIPLRGIGNEAVQCVRKENSGKSPEQVIARVRERAFVLTVTRVQTPAGVAVSAEGLSSDTRNTAEQIAGSLF